ncbi:MAG: ROK family transcriptional regulator [Gemmatimonadota bacterium]|nr:ROK family transcriptional regulator [Gemmatimonadota bacterium]
MKINVENMIAADHKVIRQINRLNVLNIIRERKAIARVDISRITGLNKSTISNIVGELIRDELVVEKSLGYSAVGRKPIILELNERSRIFGAVEIKLRRTILTICDMGRNILEHREIETDHGDGPGFFSKCADILYDMSRPHKKQMVGVGISVCVVANSMEGIVYSHIDSDWGTLDVRSIMESRLGCKVFVENDGKAGALGELWFGKEAQDFPNFVFIWVCEGIGVGMVIKNELYHGFCGMDGQFGPQLIRVDESREDIPRENYWEENASDLATIKRYSKYSGVVRGSDIEDDMDRVVDRAKNKDPHALKALRETARYLGVGIANINNGFAPWRIILGGKVCRVWDLVFPELAHQVELQTNYEAIPVKELIVPSSLEEPPFEGAQAMMIREVFGGIRLY